MAGSFIHFDPLATFLLRFGHLLLRYVDMLYLLSEPEQEMNREFSAQATDRLLRMASRTHFPEKRH